MTHISMGAALALILAATSAHAENESCKKVRFADVGWTDIQVTTGTATIVLEALGYSPEVKTLSIPVALASLKNKDVDVFLGNWMPSMTADMKPYLDDKSIDVVGVNLNNAGYGLVVPKYVADAGVKSLKNISSHKDKFGGKIYGIEAGNDGNRIISSMISNAENKLQDFELVESSEAGMLTEAEKAMKNKEWIVFLGWTPHPVMGAMDLVYLDGMGDSGFGAAVVNTVARAGYAGECPNVGKLLSNLKFDLAMEGAMMEPVLKSAADPKATALEWLKKNPNSVTPWLNGIKTFDGGDASAALKAVLAK